MDLAQIRELLEIVAESGVAEIEIEEDEFKLTIRKTAPTITMQQVPQALPYGMNAGAYAQPPYVPPAGAGQPGAAAPATSAPSAAAPNTAQVSPGTNERAAPDEAGAPAGENEVSVPAPIVGTFYRRPSPDDDPYVEVGDEVAPGDVLCIIEAMKLMNEIECEEAGTIKKILVEDAQPVEYEQPLFVIEKE